MSCMALHMRIILENLLPVLLIGSHIQKGFAKRLPPYFVCPFELDLARDRLTLEPYLARSHAFSVQYDRERKLQCDIDRGLPQLLLRQPSSLTYYFVFHHFSGLYMCDIDSPTACVSRGLPTELLFLFLVPGLNIFC